MKAGSKNIKRALSYLLILGLVLYLLPVTGFAAGYVDSSDAAIVALHKTMDTALENAVNTNLEYVTGGIEADNSEILSPPHLITQDAWPADVRNDNKINVYPMTKDMTETDRSNVVIPFICDTNNTSWYLYQIIWTNSSSIMNDMDTGTVVSADEIIKAANQSDSAAYTFDLTEINADPKISSSSKRYYIVYCWTDIAPSKWGTAITPAETYNVEYTSNLPADLGNNYRIYPYDEENVISITDGGITTDNMNADISNLSRSVVEGRYFEIGKSSTGSLTYSQYSSYLVFNHNDKIYYYLDGWKDETGKIHQYGENIEATNSLAGEDTTITLTANWTKIGLLTDEQLADYAGKLPITVFYSGNDIIDSVLITQWTDTDANTQYNDNTAGPVTLDEDGTISYLVSARISPGLTGVLDPTAMNYSSAFAEFTFYVNVDSQLKFSGLDENGKATLTFESILLKPTGTNFKVNGTDTATITDNGDGTYSITFDPSAVPMDSEENMDIQITTQWVGGKYSSSDLNQSIRLTGLDFQLKDEVAKPEAFQIETSANITGTMDMKNKVPANFRVYYRAAHNLLMGSDKWQEEFGQISSPIALIHALQYMDYKLKDINLANDPMIGQLDTNTVIATYPGTVTVTPADITIYMGGDGGYDAVVGEDGEIAPATNSLPHPLFTIDTPDGIDPEELTFTNGGDTWTVECDNPNSAGTKYYHFVPVDDDTDDVRVTYTYTDKSGKEHTVTSDKFDPTTMGDVFAELKVELYPGTSNTSQVRAIASNGAHYVDSTSGTLTIRAVEDQDATSDILDDAPEKSVAAGSAVAVKPAGGTVYTLNNTGVILPTDSKPSLLFDSIIDDEKVNRTELLEDKADEKLGAVVGNTTRHYEIKYLDLVDANNGNAWITSSEGTYIYWGYPEGTDQSTKFTVLHFQGLHREGNDSGYDASDITELGVDSVEIVSVENTENGIKFHVEAGGFSPFALVWETTFSGGGTATGYTITAEAGNGGSISPSGSVSVTAGENQTFTITADDGYEIVNVTVDNKSVGAVSSYTFENVSANHTIKAIFKEESGAADPDDTGVSDWLNTDDHAAYLSGYPNDLFGANNNMTRGEVAQMFYNLLLDKDVTITVTFEDVAADAWYADAVNTLASLGMIKGVGDNRFEPERSITRAEFTTIAMHFTNGVLEGENIFPDVNPDDWFYDYVVGSIQYGWISGYPDGTFGPNNTITRAEVTTIVNRMLGRSVDKDYVDSHTADLRQFTDLADTYWAYYDIMEATNGHEYTKIDGVEDWVRVN